MEKSVQQYKQAVRGIKDAILYSQYRAAKLVTGEQLSLYFGIGGYVFAHSRQEAWGTSVIDRISEQLRRELPGLRGFSSQNIRNMRSFYEYWRQYIICSPMASKLQIAVNKDVIDIDNFSLQKWSPRACGAKLMKVQLIILRNTQLFACFVNFLRTFSLFLKLFSYFCKRIHLYYNNV